MENQSCFLAISVPSGWVVFKNSANDFPILYLLHGGRLYISRQTKKMYQENCSPTWLAYTLEADSSWKLLAMLDGDSRRFFRFGISCKKTKHAPNERKHWIPKSSGCIRKSTEKKSYVFNSDKREQNVCVCVCQNWSLLARFATFDVCNQNIYINNNIESIESGLILIH